MPCPITLLRAFQSWRPFQCWIVVPLALALTMAPASAESIKTSTSTLLAEGKAISVERFEPEARGRYPTIVMLHGCDGMEKSGLVYRQGARLLAQQGYVVLLVHYLERTGMAAGIDAKKIAKEDYQAWLKTVRQAVQYADKQPGVDSKRKGLLGISLGGYLALEVAQDKTLGLAAVASWFGGLRPELHAGLKWLPPTLIVHDEDDKVVPVKDALAVAERLKVQKLPHELKVYKDQGHVFANAPFGKAVDDAKSRTIAFFARYLKTVSDPVAVPKK